MIMWFNFRLKLSDFFQLCFGFTHFWQHEVPEDQDTASNGPDGDISEEETEVTETFEELRGRGSVSI